MRKAHTISGKATANNQHPHGWGTRQHRKCFISGAHADGAVTCIPQHVADSHPHHLIAFSDNNGDGSMIGTQSDALLSLRTSCRRARIPP
ncbi:hypothetical protein MGN01_45510 [Methylobacterium gnaphalii]|uniref:Uncharacterized protein n=1 Tax=Methylobacterium gnaphalii TaxID=1010610 RepID=A0A512JRW8_9HYPH|nr:hypothetical protein MGN01_45510 [Methylobacterium gnaphalii]